MPRRSPIIGLMLLHRERRKEILGNFCGYLRKFRENFWRHLRKLEGILYKFELPVEEIYKKFYAFFLNSKTFSIEKI